MSKHPLTKPPHAHQLRKHPLPPASEMAERYRYDPDTGEIFNRLRPTGKPLGSIIATGYRHITIKSAEGASIPATAHRLAFAIKLGRWPVDIVHHVDGNKANNAWSNLAETDHSGNLRAHHDTQKRTVTRLQQGVQIIWRTCDDNRRTFFRNFCDAVKHSAAMEAWRLAGRQGPPPAPKRTKSHRNSAARRRYLTSLRFSTAPRETGETAPQPLWQQETLL